LHFLQNNVDSSALSEKIITEHGQGEPVKTSLIVVHHSLLFEPGQRSADLSLVLPNYPHGTLAIARTRKVGVFGPASALPAENHTAIIEFRVEDVDKEYEKGQKMGHHDAEVKSLHAIPRPDGNLVNFFSPVTAEAKARQSALRAELT
jgi:hypothetical protein